ncbi:MAG TPA: aminoglycoside phosphotransferase family protein [Reyranella sp.]|nr:aminoglycoside phosphotransferase family protein [Reyranella sp.]
MGEKIGGGESADIHAWAPGQAVKLFKAGVEQRMCRHEARMTRAAFAAGLPAPEVFDEVVLDGRFGFVLSRFEGQTLLQLLQAGALTRDQATTILANLLLSVHKTPPPLDVISQRDLMHALLRSSGNLLPKHLAPGVFALLERLPPEDGLCHGDLSVNNVIMTAEGPRLIDWTWARRSGVALDLAHSHVVLCELIPDGIDPERPRALDAAVQAEYARLAGLSPAALTAAMEPYLPIVRAFFLLVWAGSPALRERLVQRLEVQMR